MCQQSPERDGAKSKNSSSKDDEGIKCYQHQFTRICDINFKSLIKGISSIHEDFTFSKTYFEGIQMHFQSRDVQIIQIFPY